ncbi:MAG: hypothetical protein ACHQNA_03100, partial [Acidimicrobiales bacterium]
AHARRAAHARLDRFRSSVSGLRVTDPSVARETKWRRVGSVVAAAGVGLAVLAYVRSHGTTSPSGQRADRALALVGVALVVAGGTVAVRHAVSAYLRPWLARLVDAERGRGAVLSAIRPDGPPTVAGGGPGD